MKRREVLQMIAASLAVMRDASSQVQRKYRIGCLYIAEERFIRPFQAALVSGLGELGYVEGRNLIVDLRVADGDVGRLPALVDDMLAMKPDILIGIEAVAVVMKKKTTLVPIIVPAGNDLVAAGLVESLAKPGTNVTGISNLSDQLVAKHVEMLLEIKPGLARIALLNDLGSPAAQRFEQHARRATGAKGVELIVAGTRDAAGLAPAFSVIGKSRAEAVVVVTTGFFNQLRREILAHIRRLRIPAASALPVEAWGELGGLVTYGANTAAAWRHAARYVDRILRGAKPADLPVEQVSQFDLVLNLSTANELGIKIPSSIRLLANRVIE